MLGPEPQPALTRAETGSLSIGRAGSKSSLAVSGKSLPSPVSLSSSGNGDSSDPSAVGKINSRKRVMMLEMEGVLDKHPFHPPWSWHQSARDGATLLWPPLEPLFSPPICILSCVLLFLSLHPSRCLRRLPIHRTHQQRLTDAGPSVHPCMRSLNCPTCECFFIHHHNQQLHTRWGIF